MSRKTQLARARLASCANYWRNHIGRRKGAAGPCKAAFPTVQQPALPALLTNTKPGTVA